MTPRLGQLRCRLTLEAPQASPDGAGGVIEAFQPVAHMFGRVETIRRRETVDDGRVVGMVTHRITVRHRADLAGGMRFLAYGRRYRVMSVEDADETRRFLTCHCQEEQA